MENSITIDINPDITDEELKNATKYAQQVLQMMNGPRSGGKKAMMIVIDALERARKRIIDLETENTRLSNENTRLFLDNAIR